MATTKFIKKIKSRVNRTIEYVVNPNKCLFTDSENTTHDLTTGINCSIPSSSIEFENTRKQFNKNSGNLAYHIEQAFKPGELTPLECHEIGVELANRLWGERFQVVVGTHIDKEHLHNHFVLNAVSFVDGKKFNDCYSALNDLRSTSDAICREHNLSVVEEPMYRGGKYVEKLNEKSGGFTWRKIIRADIDDAIEKSLTFRQFEKNLMDKGYRFKGGMHLGVSPPGKSNFFRLYKLGKGYSEEEIVERILGQYTVKVNPYIKRVPTQQYKIKVFYRQLFQCKRGGLRGLYLCYLYRLKDATKNPNNHSYPLKEDLLKMKQYAYDLRLISREQIDDTYDLLNYKERKENEQNQLFSERQVLRNRLRFMTDTESILQVKDEAKEISIRLAKIRSDLKSCDRIESQSEKLAEKYKDDINMKEGKENGSRERVGRNDSQVGNRRNRPNA